MLLTKQLEDIDAKISEVFKKMTTYDYSYHKDVVDKHLINAPNNSEIVRVAFLNTPTFMNMQSESISKVIV